jgi:hypothetical protein
MSARAQARVFTGIGHNLPEQAPQAFIQVVVDADGCEPRKTEKPSHD